MHSISKSSSYFFSSTTIILSNPSENINYIYSRVFLWLLILSPWILVSPIGKSGLSLVASNFLRYLVIPDCVFILYLRIPAFLRVLLTEVCSRGLWESSRWGVEGSPQCQTSSSSLCSLGHHSWKNRSIPTQPHPDPRKGCLPTDQLIILIFTPGPVLLLASVNFDLRTCVLG